MKSNSYWEREFLPRFHEIYNDNKEKLITDEVRDEYIKSEIELNEEIENYNNQFSKLKFFWSKLLVFFSILLLCIPLYWSWKWYKKLKEHKEYFLNKIKDKETLKLQVHKKIYKNFKFISFFNSFNGIINYKNMGPIINSLIKEMQLLSFFDLTNEYGKLNTYSTSWGICDNKIVIHKSDQILKEYMKTYTGSITVYTYSKDSRGNLISRPHIVTATYDCLAYDIFNDVKTFTFMESCSNLEFNFEERSRKSSSKSFNKKNGFSPLENEEFEKRYNWFRNDDVQFRMIFTPYTQELFLEEDSEKEMSNQLMWRKEKSFISNQYSNSKRSYIWEKNLSSTIKEFLKNPSINLDEFINNVYKSIIDYYYGIFNSMNYIWLTTIMSSENHNTIIKSVLETKEETINKNNISLFSHYILSEFIKKQIIQINTGCFNDVENIYDLINTKKHKLYKVKMKGTSFEVNDRIKEVWTIGPTGGVFVPVHYKEYIPHHAYAFLFFSVLKNYDDELFFNEHETNIKNEDIMKIILSIKSHANIFIKNGILSVYCKREENLVEKLVNDLLELM